MDADDKHAGPRTPQISRVSRRHKEENVTRAPERCLIFHTTSRSAAITSQKSRPPGVRRCGPPVTTGIFYSSDLRAEALSPTQKSAMTNAGNKLYGSHKAKLNSRIRRNALYKKKREEAEKRHFRVNTNLRLRSAAQQESETFCLRKAFSLQNGFD